MEETRTNTLISTVSPGTDASGVSEVPFVEALAHPACGSAIRRRSCTTPGSPTRRSVWFSCRGCATSLWPNNWPARPRPSLKWSRAPMRSSRRWPTKIPGLLTNTARPLRPCDANRSSGSALMPCINGQDSVPVDSPLLECHARELRPAVPGGSSPSAVHRRFVHVPCSVRSKRSRTPSAAQPV